MRGSVLPGKIIKAVAWTSNKNCSLDHNVCQIYWRTARPPSVLLYELFLQKLCVRCHCHEMSVKLWLNMPTRKRPDIIHNDWKHLCGPWRRIILAACEVPFWDVCHFPDKGNPPHISVMLHTAGANSIFETHSGVKQKYIKYQLHSAMFPTFCFYKFSFHWFHYK